MNKVFRVIWNKAKGCYVVVGELASSYSGKSKKRSTGLVKTGLLASFIAFNTFLPLAEADEPYSIIVDQKGNIVSTEEFDGTKVQNSIAKGTYSISIGIGATTIGDSAISIGTGNIAGGNGSVVFGDHNYTGIMPEIINGNRLLKYGTESDFTYATLDGKKVYTDASGKTYSYSGHPVLVGKDDKKYVVYESGITYEVNINSNGSVSRGKRVDEPVAFADVYGKPIIVGEILGNNALAFGTNNLAVGNNSLAFGKNNMASGEGSTVFGSDNEASGLESTAFGHNNTAAGDYSVAFGESNNATGQNAVAFGDTLNEASGKGSVAWGYWSKATEKLATAWGDRSEASGQMSTAWGSESNATGKASTAWGEYTTASGEAATSWGIEDTLAAGYASTAFGYSEAHGDYATSFGNRTEANGTHSTAWGYNTKADYKIESFSNGATAYIVRSGGQNVYVDGLKIKLLTDANGEPVLYNGNTVRVANDGNGYIYKYSNNKLQYYKVTVNSNGSLAISTTPISSYPGHKFVEGKFETVENNTAFGYGTISANNQATAFGYNTVASGENATAWGEDSVASGYNSTAWGEDSVASGLSATAWGEVNKATGYAATAWGYYSEANNDEATAFGDYSKANGYAATAWGDSSEAHGDYSTAFGVESKAGGENSLAALGGTTGVYESTDDDGFETYIGGENSVAIGVGAIAKTNDSLALGSGAVADRAAGEGSDKAHHSGYNVATGLESTLTDSVWRSTQSAIAIGDAANGVTRQITGVAAGYEDTDAVNVAQLKQVREVLGSADQGGGFILSASDATNVEQNLGQAIGVIGANDNISTIADTTNKAIKIQLSNNLDLTANGSIIMGNTLVNNNGLSISNGPSITYSGIDAGGKKITNVAAGTDDADAVNVSQLREYVGDQITANDIHVDTSKEYAVVNNKVSVDMVNSEQKLIINDVAASSDVGDINNIKEELHNVDGSKTTVVDAINNVYDKLGDTISEAGKHTGITVNGGISAPVGGEYSEGNLQLAVEDNNGQKTYDIKLNENIDLGRNGSVSVGNTVINNNGLTIENGPSVTSDGIEAGGKKISNVAAGTDDNDAVNVSQLKAVDQIANKNAADINAVNGRINKLGTRINKVGAGAAALAALHPLDFDPDDKLAFSAGVGHYSGENAAAIGAFYRPTEKVMFSVAGSLGNGENMVNAGITFALDKTNNVSNSRTAMAKEIVELRSHVVKQEKQIAELTNLVNKLLGSNVVQSSKNMFPDIPENHWAYEYLDGLAKQGIVAVIDANKAGLMTRHEIAGILDGALQKGYVLDEKVLQEFKNELSRIRIDRVYGKNNEKDNIERVRVNAYTKPYECKDDYGTVIPK